MPHRVVELHNIMPIENICSVLADGILSYEQATKLAHSDISMANVQDMRSKVKVPGGQNLHQYANLYFDARNPMMYKRKNKAENLCVLSVSTEVLKIKGVVITDQNAASDYVRFYPPSSLDSLNFDQIYSDNWQHLNDMIAYWRHKSAKCAEVLVPKSVNPRFIQKAYTVNDVTRKKLFTKGFTRQIELMPRLFFE